MSIKFSCPHCQRAYAVGDDKAGLRTNCLNCKKLIVVPQPVDVDALAAAALVDEPAQEAKPAGVIEFTCPQCDEPIKVSADLAGKQAPCPECRRIIKVPLPVENKPVDWRDVHKMPAGARRDLGPAPEGAWGSTTSGSIVSRESLEEAGAIPDQRPPLTTAQKVKWGSAAVGGLVVLSLAGWWAWSVAGQNKQNRLVAQAVAAVEDDKAKLSAESKAEIHRAAGEYLLRSGKAEKAREQFQKARALLAAGGDTEREFLLRDLGMAMVDLGGEKAEVDKGAKLKWEETAKDLRQTLQNINTPEAVAEALRAVGRKLIARGREGDALRLGGQLNEVEGQGRMILELLQAGKKESADKLADAALMQFAQQPAGKGTPPAALIALFVALGKQDRLPPPPPAPKDDLDPAYRVGMAEGLARRGELDKARKIAQAPGDPLPRLEAFLAIAAANLDAQQPDAAKTDLQEAITLLEKERWAQPVSPWQFWKLVQLGAQAGMGDGVEKFTQLPDPGLKGRAQLELLKAKLAGLREPAVEGLAQTVEKGTPAHLLAVEAVARHNAALGSASTVNGDEATRPFASLGQALGMQDAASRGK
jgi:tetratricopeptide (TPR) repeat protein